MCNTSVMAQPKKPPFSVRLSDDLSARLEAWATDQGLNRNAAVKALIERGLDEAIRYAPVLPAPTLKPKPTAKPKAKPERFTGTTATGEPLPERRPLPKTPKGQKGK
jgi:hypothetical protein